MRIPSRSVVFSALWIAGVAAARGAGPPAPPVVLSDFASSEGWSAYGADGVDVALRADTARGGGCLRIDFDFRKGSGYAVARTVLEPPVRLPDNYAFSFELRGEAPVNHLEFKLIDESGENVWWSVRRDFRFPETWERVRVKKRQVRFAWGPRGGGELEKAAAIEIAITAGGGGKGTVWIDDLSLEELPPPGDTPEPIASASSTKTGSDPLFAVDGDSTTVWASAGGEPDPWIKLDLGARREYGGLVVDWEGNECPPWYAIEISDDGETWRAIRDVREGNGGGDHLYLPETESRYLRLHAIETRTAIAIRELLIQPLEFSASREAFFEAIAGDAPRGCYPRGMSGEAVYWTVVGADGDAKECLLSEDGAIEIGKGECSIEPFLFVGGRSYDWSRVRAEASLVDGCLPFPRVTWRLDDLDLVVTAFPIGEAGASSVIVRYSLTGRGEERLVGLRLAVRPFQVDPPYQFLGVPGGTARIRELGYDGSALVINGRRRVWSLAGEPGFLAATFDEGDVACDALRAEAPRLRGAPYDAIDPFEAASGGLLYEVSLSPGKPGVVDLLIPLHDEVAPTPPSDAGEAPDWVDRELEAARIDWGEKLGRVRIRLPESASEIERTLKAQLAYVLVNRAGPAIQPGSRSYARSWIRDGALTSSALLRMGHSEPVAEFIEWFAPNQYENGKIPCVVDARGPDPVPEHDSGGEFIFLIAEYERYTGDRALAEKMWPSALRAAVYLDSLRETRRTPEFREPGKKHFYGLLPPSISHEGYSAKPMHSYWDDFWALRGFKDAAYLAGVLGHEKERERWAAVRDEFERELALSIEAAIRLHGIDYVPGSADLGDFDATSTTVALSPVQAETVLPRDALARTFETYWEFFVDRRTSGDWEAFTPYEMRNIGAFVRLGWRERAFDLIGFFLSHRRPEGWAEWAEVVWRDARAPKFIGDMPHTWVGTDFIRSILDMLVFPRESDESLVVGAGVPPEWPEEPGGVEVQSLPTPFGPISFSMRAAGKALEIRIEGGLRVPPGGIVVSPPIEGEIGRVTINGSPAHPRAGGEIVVREVPAIVVVAP